MRKRSPQQEHPASPPRASAAPTTHCLNLFDDPHEIEYAVRRHLLAHPQLKFSSLVIRRIKNGICLEGVLDAEVDMPDVCSLVQSITGVDAVLNHLVVRKPPSLPAKG